MMEISSCFGDQALNFSSPSCSFSSTKSSYISPSPFSLPSIRNAITCVYRTNLPSRKTQILVVITWCRAPVGHRLIVEFGCNSMEESPCIRIGTNPMFGRNRGQKKVAHQNSDIVVSWDFSKSKFDAWSPEPVDGFFVSISIDSELGLMLRRAAGSRESDSEKAVLVSKREELSGNGLYSTKARFCPKGDLHDILVKCRGTEQEKEEGNNQGKQSSILHLHLYVDRKLVMKVKRLQWNFRGSQTIFMDGSAIDFMWNVYDWFYNAGTGPGIFMFKTRNRNDVGFCGDEKTEEDGDGFSMLICASKSPR